MARRTAFAALTMLFALALSAGLYADIPFFWLDSPKGRDNPHDPKNPFYAPEATATAIPQNYYDAKDPGDNYAAGATPLVAQSAASASAVSAGPHYIGYLSDTQDWYLVTVTPGEAYAFTAVRAWGSGSLDVQVFNAAQTVLLASGTASTGNTVASYSIPVGVTQILVVVNHSGSIISYALEHQNVSAPASVTATATQTLTPRPSTATSQTTFSPTSTDPGTPTVTGTDTSTQVPATSTQTPLPTAVDSATQTSTLLPTPASPTATRSATPSASVTETQATPPTQTPTATRSFTRSATATPTGTASRTVTTTPTASPTQTASPSATPLPSTILIYDGDTLGYRLVDGTVTNNESGAVGATGTMTQTTGGNPNNMMQLTYGGQSGWWQSHSWNNTVNVPLGGTTDLVFEVKQDAASPGTVNQFKVAINWPGTDVFVDAYLVAGGTITTAWKTVRIPLAVLLGPGQTQVDFISFINNWSANYTVDIDNIRLETTTPTATSTITMTSTRTQTPNPAWSSTFTSTITPTPSGYSHPGAWSSAAELAFVKTKIAAAQQPWTQQLSNLIGQTGGAPSGVNFNGTTQNSCTQEGAVQTDSALCYANALAWYLTGTTSYYTKAMAILANYATLQGFQSTGCFSGQHTLDAAWFGVLFANACELLRTSPSWTPSNTTTYVNMFKTAYYPTLNAMSPDNGNIDLTEIDAMFSMAVFCDDPTEWALAVSRYQARMPAYIYSSAWPVINAANNPDVGNTQPYAIPGGNNNTNNPGCAAVFPMNFWYCPLKWTGGLTQETCRDNGHHVQFALDAAVQCAEIDYHQGSPNTLYASYQTSLVPALELLSQQFVTNTTIGTCAGAWNPAGQVLDTFEIGFNHYANRVGLGTASGTGLFYTNQWLTSLRANAGTTWLQFNIAYETLTHAGVN